MEDGVTLYTQIKVRQNYPVSSGIFSNRFKNEGGPLIHFRNPRIGVSIWPVMAKDSAGNWNPSAPAFVEV
jgi:hypothetical protein